MQGYVPQLGDLEDRPKNRGRGYLKSLAVSMYFLIVFMVEVIGDDDRGQILVDHLQPFFLFPFSL